jgi:hypothetical protein
MRGCPSFVASTACTGGHLTHCCCVGTLQVVEIAMRPRIGVLDHRVAIVLDARPHRWPACRRWCQGIGPSADRHAALAGLLRDVEQ